jgi:glycosyltransferase involved in cell wall biosynthesis
MKIALIGPGLMEIPPKNWGAVESLIWDYSEYLQQKNVDVNIINHPNLNVVAEHINSTDYDFVHVQYDDHAGPLSYLLKKPFCTTMHYGYIKEHYGNYNGWKPIFDGILKSPGIFSLSPEITNLVKSAGYNNFIRTVRNGARTKDFKFKTDAQNYAICLGKIEHRKKQSFLASVCANRCKIDFIGPRVDSSFKENNTCKYGGLWTKPDLYEKMTDYKCLVLLSDGEAAPLVVPEALSAGLSIVVSRTAAANLDTTLPFIHVVDELTEDNIVETINNATENNHKYRKQIRQYAFDVFDWSVICDHYLNCVKEFLYENSICNYSNK